MRTDSLTTDIQFVSLPARSGIHALGIAAYASRKIVVKGNNVRLASMDTTPSAGDGKDFGTVALFGSQYTAAFTIGNSGENIMSLTGSPRIAISGGAAADFRVNTQPATSAIAPGNSVSFAITFDPSLPGQRTATVTIASDDPDTPLFTFDISGFGSMPGKLAQTITFAPPAALYAGQGGYTLGAFSSSGLPVTLSLVSGTAMLSGKLLFFNQPGIVKIQASGPGSDRYSAAPR